MLGEERRLTGKRLAVREHDRFRCQGRTHLPAGHAHDSAELRVLGCVVAVLWWVLSGPCFGAYGAAANSMRMAALSTTFEPAKLEEGEEALVLRGPVPYPTGRVTGRQSLAGQSASAGWRGGAARHRARHSGAGKASA